MSDSKTPVGNETCSFGNFWRLVLCMPPEQEITTERVYRPAPKGNCRVRHATHTSSNRSSSSSNKSSIGRKNSAVNESYGNDNDNDEDEDEDEEEYQGQGEEEEETHSSEKQRWEDELRAREEKERQQEEKLAGLKEVLNNNAMLKDRDSRAADLKVQREIEEVRHKFRHPSPSNHRSTNRTDSARLSRSATPTSNNPSSQNGATGFAVSGQALQAHTPVTSDEAEHLFDRLVHDGINCIFFLPSRSGAAKPKNALLRCPRGQGMMHLDVQTSASSSRTKTLSFEMASEIGEIRQGKGPLIVLPVDTQLDNVLHIMLVDKPEMSLCFEDALAMSMMVAGLNRHVTLQHAKARNNSSRLSVLSTIEQEQTQQAQQRLGEYEDEIGNENLVIAQDDAASSPQQQSAAAVVDPALRGLSDRSVSMNSAFSASPRSNANDSPRDSPRLPSTISLLTKDLVKLTAFYWIGSERKGYQKNKKTSKLLTTYSDQTMQIFLVPIEYDSCSAATAATGSGIEASKAVGRAAAEQKSLGIKLIKLFDAQWSPAFLVGKGFTVETTLYFSDIAQTTRTEDGEDGDIDITCKDETIFTVTVQDKEKQSFIQSMEAKRRAARALQSTRSAKL